MILSQNFQLVGEENKFPASLQSFALPKFDFYVHLQVQLKFDSIVDTEVLLGIQGQDNNWIDDFSSGTSAIEFSSSAAENRSIYRHNNVWSEGTSSESVEMLLSSVGEDDVSNKKYIAMDADARNGLHEIVNKTGSFSRQVDDNSMVRDITENNPSVPPDTLQANLLRQGEGASGAQPQVEGLSEIFSSEKSSSELDGSSLGNKNESDRNISPVDNDFLKASDGRDGRSSVESEVSRETAGSITCKTKQDDYSSVSITNLIRSSGDLDDQVLSEHEHTVISMTERSNSILEDVHKEGNQMSIDSKGNDFVKTVFVTGGSSSFLEPTKDCMMLISEGGSATGFSGNSDGLLEAIAYQVKPLNNDNEAGFRSSTQADKTNSVAIDGTRCSETNAGSSDNSGGGVQELPVEMHDSIHMNCEKQVKETHNRNDTETKHFTSSSQSLEPVAMDKSIGADSVEDAEKVDSKLIAFEDATIAESSLDNAEVETLSTFPDRSDDVAEPSDASKPSVEANINSNEDGNVILRKGDNATSGGQTDSAEANINSNEDGNVILRKGDNATSGGQTDSRGGTTPIFQNLVQDGSVTDCDGKEVRTYKTSSAFALKNSDVQLLVEPVIISDPIRRNLSSSGEMIQDVPVVKEASFDESVKLLQSQDSTVANVVLEHKERAASSSLEFIQPAEVSSRTSKISSSITSRENLDGQGSSRQLKVSDITESSALSNTKEPEANNQGHSSSCADSSVASESELHVSVDKPTTHEQSVLSVEKGNEHSDGKEASSHETKETTTVSFSDACGNLDTNMSRSLPTSRTEGHLLEAESGKLSLPEPNCGSPTVISSIEHSQDEAEGGNFDKIKSTTLDSRENVAFEDDRNFTFEVGTVAKQSAKETKNEWKPISSLQSPYLPKILKENLEVKKTGNENSAGNEDKASNVTSIEILTTPKGKSAKGTSTRRKSTNSNRKSGSTSTPSRSVCSSTKLEEVLQHVNTEISPKKISGSPNFQTPGLPDLNSSVSSITPFHQPFTDLQQVQLRAQIFVYGSLIQGIPPDEACMQSAFGETEKGRSLWESVWHICVERYQSLKSPVSSETPLRSQSVVRGSEQVTKSSLLQTKAASTAASTSQRSTSKPVPSTILNSTPPLPSPLWSISTHDGLNSTLPRGAPLDFSQALSPLHAYPSSQTRQFACSSTPWLPQNPRPGPWAVSAHCSLLTAATQYSPVPIVETVKVPPKKDLSTTSAADVPLAPSCSLLPTQSPAIVASGNNKSGSSSTKSRKRKKTAGSENPPKTSSVSQSLVEPASATLVSVTVPPASSGLSFFANSPAKMSTEPTVTVINNMTLTNYQIAGSNKNEQRITIPNESATKFEEAKSQAEETASHAASVLSHRQGIWNKLAAERNSGLEKEVEEKLSSAAVAVSAAASVAKAAAAAAKIASDAALQAKMMADEAARLSSGSVLKGKEKIHCSGSVISAAHEATRRRVEAASSAAKRAENLDAIMKAAEMAAEAVYQVGTIIAMGDPLPFKLSDLVEAGPDGYWKAYQSTSEKVNKGAQTPLNSKQIEIPSIEDERNCEESMPTKENCSVLEIAGSTSYLTNDSRANNTLSSSQENTILKGSLVEVFSNEDGLRGGWFSARVIDVKDVKACVSYNNLLAEDGSGQLKEWISLDSESDGAPRIRVAHPVTVTKSDGTKKRRREAVATYIWEVGDRVDAWMRDGWWEGIIKEKSQVDDTKLTVHFPAAGDTSLVRAWDLRPSLIWMDGQWIEWSRARENTQPYEGDTPQEKRQKLGRPETKTDADVNSRGMDKLLKKVPPEESTQPQELRPLNLSSTDRIFNVGKTISKDNISDAIKVKRTGPQKEGSRVVFGVPKPGKKRKFMDVSKHYVSDKIDKESQGNNDPLKFSKYLMPQTSRPWRNTNKVDSKVKPDGDSKPVGVKPVKSQTTQSRKITGRNNSSNSRNNSRGTSPSMAAGVNNVETNSHEVVSFSSSLRTTDSLVAVSSVHSVPTVPASKKKPSLSADADPGVKGRPASTSDKSARSEDKPAENAGKAIPGASEPRRSNRRIQPTSRLLEGLQSSLIISKIPSFSHEKGSKAQQRGSASRGNARG